MQIKKIHAREILDSRGNPTVEVDLHTDMGVSRSMVPSGASTGIHEALELRDGDNSRYFGKGVLKAVSNINDKISKVVVGMLVSDQEAVDKKLIKADGTPNKSNFGANAILAVSMATCKAAAMEEKCGIYEHIAKLANVNKFILPVPMCNVINGGRHAGQENSIQEHMMMPTGAKSFSEGIRLVAESYHELSKILKKRFGAGGILIGDEGGFAPPQINSVDDRIQIMVDAVKNAGHEGLIKIALDAAASEFYKDGVYKLGEKSFSGGELIDFYKELIDKFPIISIEDGHAEDDWENWTEMTAKLGNKIQIVGDDLFVTNSKRIKKGIDEKSANSVLIKVNQIGTVTETLEAMKLAKNQGWTNVVSHRSGETEDSFIADLVVGTSSGQSKFGGPTRSDRNSKYNQLLRIEEGLGEKGSYAGENFKSP